MINYSNILSIILFTVIIALNIFNLEIKLETKNIQIVEKEYQNIVRSAISISGLGLAAFFLARILRIKIPMLLRMQ